MIALADCLLAGGPGPMDCIRRALAAFGCSGGTVERWTAAESLRPTCDREPL